MFDPNIIAAMVSMVYSSYAVFRAWLRFSFSIISRTSSKKPQVFSNKSSGSPSIFDEVFDKLHEVWAKGEEKENGEDAACSNNIDMSGLHDKFNE
ncbi:hypothetical protein VE00_08513 [Pseudogymnoascus sp. WSF 3629]|nr:hypothetical protein VE00_08513 [Pseudogymnoascus sp. WSF 3629]